MAICKIDNRENVGKFKIGDKVKRINFNNTYGDGRVLKVGTVGIVTEIESFDNFITLDVNGVLYDGNDPANLKLVEATKPKCKFKVGDMVIGNHPTRYYYTKKGWIGEVVKVHSNGAIDVVGECDGRRITFDYLEPKYFDLYNPEKIVITHDGKITTATLYREDDNEVKATAKCSPEDTFDFNVGAELAMERLMKKVKPTEDEWRVVNRPAKKGDYVRIVNPCFSFNECGDILKVYNTIGNSGILVLGKDHPRDTGDDNYDWCYCPHHYEVVEKVTPINIDGFKVGDRVNYKGINGTVICLAASGLNRIGVEFDKATGIAHRCEHIPLIAGTIGTKCTCRWVTSFEITHGEVPEPPKYFNGKVICVANGNVSKDLTIGRIYNFVDGNCKSDLGGNILSIPAKDCEDLNSRWSSNVKFIPLVE